METSPARLRKRGSGFTQVPNQLINDNRLSFRAKGIWALVESKPDGWVFREANLIAASTEGRDAFRAAAKELIGAGWLRRFQERNEAGHFVTIYEFLYSPLTENPSTVSPSTDEPSTESQATYKDGVSNTDKVIKTSPPKGPQGPCAWEEDLKFMKVVEAYKAVRADRIDLKRSWDTWNTEGFAKHSDAILAAVPVMARSDQWKKDNRQYVPRMSRFLNERVWMVINPDLVPIEDRQAYANEQARKRNEWFDKQHEKQAREREQWLESQRQKQSA